MNPLTARRLFAPAHAFDEPVVLAMVLFAAGALALSVALTATLRRAGVLGDDLHRELRQRNLTWAFVLPLLFVPVLLGAGPAFAVFLLIALACYREYARATGLFRHPTLSAAVVLAILAVFFAAVDHWYGLFVAVWPLAVSFLAAVSLLGDRPVGYIQRTALAVFAFALLGAGFAHIAYFANDPHFRAIILWLILAVIVSDIAGYLCGRLLGRRKLCPNTSPRKTLAGSLGALLFAAAFAAAVGAFVFAGQPVGQARHLVVLGLIIAAAAQLGDLMVSAIKRDLGLKDIGCCLPGHGGLLDRFDSLLLVAPAAFHYIGYLQGVGLDQPPRIITG